MKRHVFELTVDEDDWLADHQTSEPLEPFDQWDWDYLFSLWDSWAMGTEPELRFIRTEDVPEPPAA